MNISFVELLRYTQEERDKWRGYFTNHPEAMELSAAGWRTPFDRRALIDHIFLVERRHLQRLMNEPVDSKPD
jgi:hypothetical protein